MMTAYVTFAAIKNGELSLQQEIICSQVANSQEPTVLGLPVGGTITLEAALQVLILKSANDVAVMLAEAVAGSHEAFVGIMNATAARLGMAHTRFVNANGLPAKEQVTTARDLAKLAVAITRDYPQYAYMWATAALHVGKRHFRTFNTLLVHYPGADGMKTGFICDSGFNIVASASREGRRLIAVVLGEATFAGRGMRAANLLEHGFRTYQWKQLFEAKTINTLPEDKNAKATVTAFKKVASPVCGGAVAADTATKRRQLVTGDKSSSRSPQ
jgi:D-alanyl-D-alanine carboxypeptidase